MHRDIVYHYPEGVEELGSSPVCKVQGMYKKGKLITVRQSILLNHHLSRLVLLHHHPVAVIYPGPTSLTVLSLPPFPQPSLKPFTNPLPQHRSTTCLPPLPVLPHSPNIMICRSKATPNSHSRSWKRSSPSDTRRGSSTMQVMKSTVNEWRTVMTGWLLGWRSYGF